VAGTTHDDDLIERLRELAMRLMLVPGLSGHEDGVRRVLAAELAAAGIQSRTDRIGNLIASIAGQPGAPSVMLFTHMDQLGLVVSRIEPDGFVRVERVGGIPERALAAQPVRLCVGRERQVLGIIGNKSHHATPPDEKYRVVPYGELFIDVGEDSAEGVRARGIDIGTPVVYEPSARPLGERRLAGTAIDDRAGCAVVLETARALAARPERPNLHIVFSVLEEFNLRGATVAANVLRPDIAIQVDLALAADTPDMRGRGEVRLGGGPAMSLYNFHGRGTLNGTIPHPALVRLFEATAAGAGLPLQRYATTGVLTDASYVQLTGEGVASIDLAFPCRYTHSAREVCDLGDMADLVALLVAGIGSIDANFNLDRDALP
jgi:putative aminopeptidase FrvX